MDLVHPGPWTWSTQVHPRATHDQWYALADSVFGKDRPILTKDKVKQLMEIIIVSGAKR